MGSPEFHARGQQLVERALGQMVRIPDEWAAIEDMYILDPDGWRADGKSWDEPITLAEFQRRAAASTTRIARGSWSW